ncbi:Type 4 prepilin-like proteins leader peptide-processing enzyme [compost metagenome]
MVVHRLPKIMEQQWADECRQHAEEQALAAGLAPDPVPAVARISLSTPRSRCPHCGHAIRWYENVPVLSYLALRGKCAGCKAGISPRYPLVELTTAALFAFCLGQWGLSPTGLAWCGFSAALLTLALIDWDTTFLPDDITLPLLWAGLLAAALGWTNTPLADAVWGAAAGYLSLWLVYWGFKWATGKDGMGYGDFKLFAALGAWFGWPALVPMILAASVIGAIVGLAMKFRKQLREGGYIPFGPFLAGAGLAAMLFGPQQMLDRFLRLLGL